VPVTTKVEVYLIQNYAIKFVSDLRQVVGILRVFPRIFELGVFTLPPSMIFQLNYRTVLTVWNFWCFILWTNSTHLLWYTPHVMSPATLDIYIPPCTTEFIFLRRKIIPQVRNWPNLEKFNWKIIEGGKVNTPNSKMRDPSLSWLGTGTSIKSGRVKLILWLFHKTISHLDIRVRFMVFNATFNNILVISWRLVLLM
jgi:hypothetical protein